MILTIEGNIGAGKSTFAKALNEELKSLGFKTVHIEEPVGGWSNLNGVNLLEKFYNDKSKWSFAFQVNALLDAIKNECKAAQCSTENFVVVMERSTFSVFDLFSHLLADEKYLQPVEMSILKKIKTVLPNHVPCGKNNITIYLKTDPQICYERLKKRARAEEVGKIDLNYIEKLHKIHEQKILVENIWERLILLDGAQNSWTIDLKPEDNNSSVKVYLKK